MSSACRGCCRPIRWSPDLPRVVLDASAHSRPLQWQGGQHRSATDCGEGERDALTSPVCRVYTELERQAGRFIGLARCSEHGILRVERLLSTK